MFSFSVVAGRAAVSVATAVLLVAGASLAPASAADAHSQGGAASSVSASGYVKRVWTKGFQTEINRCRGAVDVTAVYRVRTIAERSDCGGASFPTTPGAVVTLVGLNAGRYRVIGVVAHLNGRVNRIADIPRGYPLLFQTCARGYTDIRFVALAPLT